MVLACALLTVGGAPSIAEQVSAGDTQSKPQGNAAPATDNGQTDQQPQDKEAKQDKAGGASADTSSREKKDDQSEKDRSTPSWLSAFRKERDRWKEAGIDFSLEERSEVWANLTGGGKRGTSYNGQATGKIDFDLEKLLHWQGAEVLVQAYDIRGHGPSRSHVGNLQLVSSTEATPSVKLYDLWLDQSFLDKKLSIRFGQEGANDELMTTTYGGLFLNSSFGFPGVAAAVLPSGGPNYPLATPFVRAKLKPDDRWTLMGAVFNGDPAPRGRGDPQIRDRNGTAFRVDDHALALAEIWYSPDPEAPEELPTVYKVGAWYSSSRFADQRFDASGIPLASPGSTGLPLRHTGDWAVYGTVDQMLWKRPGKKDQGIGLFLQVMAAPADRNLTDLSVIGGLNWRAPFDKQPDDLFGLAVAHLGISSAAHAFSRDLVTFGRAVSPYASSETVVELTYSATLTNWLSVQPDVQLVVNPGAAIAGNFGNRPLRDAVAVGMRVTIKL